MENNINNDEHISLGKSHFKTMLLTIFYLEESNVMFAKYKT